MGLEVGNMVKFERGPLKNKRNRWRVRYVGGGRVGNRFAFLVRPLNGRQKGWQYIVVDRMLEIYDKIPFFIPKELDTDEEWNRLAEDYTLGRRYIRKQNKRPLIDQTGFDD